MIFKSEFAVNGLRLCITSLDFQVKSADAFRNADLG
jgi:hypothetical protein